MFYISSKKAGLVYGITDTDDNVEEFYGYDDILKFLKQGIKIFGVSGYSYEPKIRVLCDAEIKLFQLQRGMPCRLKLSNNLDWKQCLYLGVTESYFIFFDDSGVNGIFNLSMRYIDENGVKVDVSHNDTTEVARLVNALNSGNNFNKEDLLELMKKWKKLHNPTTDREVASYLDLAPIGTRIEISYWGTGDGTRQRFDSVSRITRVKDGDWVFNEDINTFDGKKGNSFTIGLFGLQCCLYGHIKNMEVLFDEKFR